MKIVKVLYKYISALGATMRWHLQYVCYSVFYKKGKPISLIRPDSLGTRVILVPHADDEFIGCSQILSNRNEERVCAYFHMYGNNLEESNMRVRDEEIIRYVTSVGASIVDAREEGVLTRIVSNADSVFLPCPLDWHWQHKEVFNTLVSILDRIPESVSFYYYYITVPFPASYNLVGIPMTRKNQKEKWNAFRRFYKSQSFMPVLRFMYNERLDSRGNTCYAAEVYLKRSREQLLHDSRITPNEHLLKSSIGNIIKIRNLSSSFNGLSE